MSLISLPPHHHARVQPHRLAEYAALGGGTGAATHVLGAALLRPLDPDHFQLAGAALAGLAGGAALNGAYGVLAALSPGHRIRHQLHRAAGVTLLSASLGGLVGAAVLGAAGGQHPPPGHLVAAGVLGGAVLGAAGAGLRLASWVCCLCWPGWLAADAPSEHSSVFGDDEEHQRGLVERMRRAVSQESFASAQGGRD